MKLIADLHTHTVASTHAFSTVTEIVRHAADLGMAAVAITDHGIAMPDAPHVWHFKITKTMPKEMYGVRILWGVEANVMSGGELDMARERLLELDWVVASMHRQTALDLEYDRITANWLKIARDPLVDALGHMGSPRYACDYEAVVEECAVQGKLIEINVNSFRVRPDSIPNCREIARLCMRYGTRICVDSDAHFHPFVGDAGQAATMLDEIGFPDELIVNTSRARLEEYLENRPRTRLREGETE